MSNIPAAKLLAFSGTAVRSGPAEFAHDRSPRRRPHTILRSDRAGERSDHPVTSERSSCGCNDATVALFRFRRAREYPATKVTDQHLPRT